MERTQLSSTGCANAGGHFIPSANLGGFGAGQAGGVAATQPADLHEEYANKAAEVTVLRNRLQQVERDNARLLNDLAAAKGAGTHSDFVRRSRGDIEKLQTELRYTKQDLFNSEEERRRLQSTLRDVQADAAALKPTSPAVVQNRMPEPSGTHLPAAVVAPPTVAAPAAVPIATAAATISQPMANSMPASTVPMNQSTPAPTSLAPSMTVLAQQVLCPKYAVLQHALACWEATAQVTSHDASTAGSGGWFALRSAMSSIGGSSPANVVPIASLLHIASLIASQLSQAASAANWGSVKNGMCFIRLWFGLCPEAASKLVSGGEVLYQSLAQSLHAVVLDQGKCNQVGVAAGSRDSCIAEVLSTCLEVTGKLTLVEMPVLAAILHRPSLCALLAGPPAPGSFHVQCLRLMSGLLACPEIFALAHQADSSDNPLLAAANFLIVPSIPRRSSDEVCKPEDEHVALSVAAVPSPTKLSDKGAMSTKQEHVSDEDSIIYQKCRESALELFCRCIAVAPEQDIVLQLRGTLPACEDQIDTVLQRVVILCHHELLCLGLMSGFSVDPWYGPQLNACAQRRLRCVKLSLAMLSKFAWHAAPWSAEKLNAEERKEVVEEHYLGCARACDALGRTRPLLASIVDMIVRRASCNEESLAVDHSDLLTAVSCLRPLLTLTDGKAQVESAAVMQDTAGASACRSAVAMAVDA